MPSYLGGITLPIFDFGAFAPSATPCFGGIDLSVREIEDAGLREILQTPGAALGNWKILDALLDPTSPYFTFQHPLGHAREVKTAISGLFGRFVARAFATRYLDLTRYAHVRKPPMTLSAPMAGVLRRVVGGDGDMPDWVAWGPVTGMAIVEAKGCHDSGGPSAALERAVAQAARAEIVAGGAPAPFKRFAIATRWGFAHPKLSRPMLWVHDPDEEGNITEEERHWLAVGIARRHGAALLDSLGHSELAAHLLRLVHVNLANVRRGVEQQARDALERATVYRVQRSDRAPEDELIGGFVTKGGPLREAMLSPDEQALLSRLELRPTFVGIERREIKQWIEGILPETKIETKIEVEPFDARGVGEDGAGSWVVRLDEDDAQVLPLQRLL